MGVVEKIYLVGVVVCYILFEVWDKLVLFGVAEETGLIGDFEKFAFWGVTNVA